MLDPLEAHAEKLVTDQQMATAEHSSLATDVARSKKKKRCWCQKLREKLG